jgi:uncharacterized membrane protein YhaH (DUF805 family)
MDMNEIIENYKRVVLERYTTFEGRANRPEFWYFVLASLIISVILDLFGSMLSSIYSLAVLLPSVAVGIRRMHDIDRSGWWILFPLYNIYLAAQEGTKGANRFGPAPDASQAPILTAVPEVQTASTESTPAQSVPAPVQE